MQSKILDLVKSLSMVMPSPIATGLIPLASSLIFDS